MKISFDEAISSIQAGEVIAIPTDTVYGLAASIHHPRAIERLFAIKNRPLDKPFVLLLSDPSQLDEYNREIPDVARKLAAKHWPGPLTMILPAQVDRIPAIARSGMSTLGVRIPNHPMTLELIQACGPIFAPSANFSDAPPPTSADEIDPALKVPILDGGPCQLGQPSTIIEFGQAEATPPWRELRKGPVNPELSL